MNVDDVFRDAMALHKKGIVRQASERYRNILKKYPKHADALHLLGVCENQLGNRKEAIKLVEAAIQQSPNTAIYYNNLSAICRQAGLLEKAMKASSRALTLDSSKADYHISHAAVLFEKKMFGNALKSYKNATALNPGSYIAELGCGDCLAKLERFDKARKQYEKMLVDFREDVAVITRLGIMLRKLGEYEGAIHHYERSLRRVTDSPEIYNNLAILYQMTGNISKAKSCYEKIVELQPDDSESLHMLHSLSGQTTKTAPQDYVKKVFDDYADVFDQHLVKKLKYKVPMVMADELVKIYGGAIRGHLLDLGCGTGLVGEHLHKHEVSMTGVDLSPGMIERANDKALYDHLYVSEIYRYLTEADANVYEIIVSADVFIYLGELRDIFQEVSRVLVVGGYFTFSIEINNITDEGYHLNDTGRYSHAKFYIEQLADLYAFEVASQVDLVSRYQNEQPVQGAVYILKNTAAS